MGGAYAVSIYGMLAMPFLIAGAFGFFLWRASRRMEPGPELRDSESGSGASRVPY